MVSCCVVHAVAHMHSCSIQLFAHMQNFAANACRLAGGVLACTTCTCRKVDAWALRLPTQRMSNCPCAIPSHAGSHPAECRRWIYSQQKAVLELQYGLERACKQGGNELESVLRKAAAQLPAPDTIEEPKDASDSSCGSSTCGSSVMSGSSAGSTGRRLVAMRSRLSYNIHWARKPTL